MRALFLSLALASCATAPPLIEGQNIAVLNSAQLELAFDGRAACLVYPEDGTCESVIYSEHFGSTARTIREVGATDIGTFVNDGMAQYVRQLPMFTGYSDLFARLETQRAAGDFRYVKQVTSQELILEHATGQWCSRASPGDLFEDSQFYFSNDLQSSIANDEHFDLATERELRAFLRAIISDLDFRSGIEARARENGEVETFDRLFGMLDGSMAVCTSYGGSVEGGRIELTTMNVFVDGHPEPSLARAVNPYPRDSVIPLRGN